MSSGISVDQTQTPNFKRWFRDSKVVDQDRKPLVVYHATDWNALAEQPGKAVFDFSRLGEVTDRNASDPEIAATARLGVWFNDQPGKAKSAMGSDYELSAFLRIENPYDVAGENGLEQLSAEIADAGGPNEFVDRLKDLGYDGIRIQDEEFGGTSFVIFDPKQAKSATDNIGTFDPGNPDIRFSIEETPGEPDMEDADARAVAILKQQYGEVPDFDEKEVAAFLKGKGFDVTEKEARDLLVKAIYEARADRIRERNRRNAKQRDKWLYDNVPIYRHAVDFGGSNFKIRLCSR